MMPKTAAGQEARSDGFLARAFVLALLGLGSCFHRFDPETVVCQMGATAACPQNYVCTPVGGGATKCRRPGGQDGSTQPADGAAVSADGQAQTPLDSAKLGDTPGGREDVGPADALTRQDVQTGSGGSTQADGPASQQADGESDVSLPAPGDASDRGTGGIGGAGGVTPTGGATGAGGMGTRDTAGAGGTTTAGGGGQSGTGGMIDARGIDAPEAGGAGGSGGDLTTGGVGGSGGTNATGGTSGAGECSPGTHTCSGNSLLICDANGNWPSAGTPCTYVCRANTCAGQCRPGDHSCSGDSLLTCDVNGNWPTTGDPCTYVCRNNGCTGQCKPSDSKCSNNTLLTCASDGNWPTTGLQCGAGTTCSTSAVPPGCVCALTQCADGRCIDTSADPMNCGACDHACPGACSGSSCICTAKSAANLMPNAGFDSSDLTGAGWFPFNTNVSISYSSTDVLGCAGSGSLQMTYLGNTGTTSPAVGPCVAVSASTSYDLGGWVHLPSARSPETAIIEVIFYLETTCNTSSSTGPTNPISMYTIDAYDVWQYLHVEGVTPPAGTKGARMSVTVYRNASAAQPPQAFFDSVYITPAPGRF